MKKYIFILFFTLFCLDFAQAGHIIGGEITYKWVKNDTYKVTMDVYRDCVLIANAAFDSAKQSKFIGTVTIFNGVDIFKVIDLDSPDIIKLELDDNECFEIPNVVCVERGRYEFEIDLPQSPNSYHITYQRCCRNVTITNVVSPVSVGTTFTVEISAEAQKMHFSGATFKNVPAIVICVNEQLSFDHSADVEGDVVMKYEICSALDGAGIKTGNKENDFRGPFEINGVAPNPDAPPPYRDASYREPYSPISPLIGDPALVIDSLTGELFGVPTVIGQFVVTICATAYTKNGDFLTTIRREFQFNVTDCKSLVYADILEDENLGFKTYGVNSCGEQTIKFENESHDQNFIKSTNWTFNINGNEQRYAEWSPTINFPDTGVYYGTLILNPNTACDDSASIIVHIYPEIIADIEFAHDPCKDAPVTFVDQSIGEGVIDNWAWDINNEFDTTVQNTIYSFTEPGNKVISLAVSDKNGCTDTLVQDFLWTPVPYVLVIAPITFDGCSRKKINFSMLANPVSEDYDINWDFDDGTFSDELNPSHTFFDPGVYSIKVEITSPSGCYVSELFPNWIKIRPSPIADFSWSPEKLSNFNITADFVDESTGAKEWNWNFGDLSTDQIPNPSFTFPDTGLYQIRQIVTHESGCTDTIFRLLDVEPIVKFFLPSAFSPNVDGINDDFKAKGVFLSAIKDYRMMIWNRWGEVVFESDNPYDRWIGTKQNVGKACPQGIYTCVVEYLEPRGQKIQLKTFITLVN